MSNGWPACTEGLAGCRVASFERGKFATATTKVGRPYSPHRAACMHHWSQANGWRDYQRWPQSRRETRKRRSHTKTFMMSQCSTHSRHSTWESANAQVLSTIEPLPRKAMHVHPDSRQQIVLVLRGGIAVSLRRLATTRITQALQLGNSIIANRHKDC